jgi:hypothetical protein
MSAVITAVLGRPLRRLLLPVYVLVTLLVLLEGGVRVCEYSEHYICDPKYIPF